ncbi:hypothetical protein J1G44_14290 [Cellulomonas sp. zg-ZUI199]|uniref:FAD-binding domain-containing protein n=1 Tax=Cellulomonas wangleii TaxID=2816956 RepID=A0ABX8DAX8_9CELL|nr:hypothetical protein [Cellulomonas wangleii]MBO0925644.1 hypothetical protein [Cellulomonas wangleii]QVI64401.1 hypothetical protein KG103_10135 [Cellulomonas wangleii]
MLGLLLARAGVEVTVLEKHADFLRDFRGADALPSHGSDARDVDRPRPQDGRTTGVGVADVVERHGRGAAWAGHGVRARLGHVDRRLEDAQHVAPPGDGVLQLVEDTRTAPTTTR